MSEKKIILIFGKRGTGKTELAKKLIETERRLLIFDTLGEYETGVLFDSEEDALFRAFWKRSYRGNFRFVYRPLQPAVQIEEIAWLVFMLGKMTFVVEEIDCFCTAYQISESFAHIVQRGRHRDITMVGVTQRPYGIHRLLTSQAKEIYIFGTNEPRDREYLKALCGQGIEGKLDALEQYQYIHWQDGKPELEIGKVEL